MFFLSREASFLMVTSTYPDSISNYNATSTSSELVLMQIVYSVHELLVDSRGKYLDFPSHSPTLAFLPFFHKGPAGRLKILIPVRLYGKILEQAESRHLCGETWTQSLFSSIRLYTLKEGINL